MLQGLLALAVLILSPIALALALPGNSTQKVAANVQRELERSGLRRWGWVVVGVLVLFLLSSLSRWREVGIRDYASSTIYALQQMESQRDVYLLLSAMLTFVLILRALELLGESYRLSVNSIALEKQAKQAGAAYAALLDEKSLLEKSSKTESLKLDKEELMALEKLCEAQKKQITDLKSERDALKTQLADYDFMFGDKLKKQK